MPREQGPARKRDLAQLCPAAEQIIALVRDRLSGTAPEVRDWNHRLLIEAVARGSRCLESIRELACSGRSEDAYVLTRALVSLTLQYLWLARIEDEAERRDRLNRLELRWVGDRAKLGEELMDLNYLPVDGMEQDVAELVEQFRTRAKQLEQEGIRPLPSERDMALQLDRELEPTQPRFFELLYARIYRPTSQVVHYGIGAAVRGGEPTLDEALYLEYTNEGDAADALGLALVTYGALLDFSEPVMKHGLAKEVSEIIERAHA
jgi:uncharacterized protein DUF5677